MESKNIRITQRGGDLSPVSSVAADIISSATHERPADTVLREMFARRRDWSAQFKGEVSAAVFDYFRWYGWVKDEATVESGLRRAWKLAASFAENPDAMLPESLRSNAAPAWIGGEVELRDPWLRSLQSKSRLWLRAKKGQGRALAKKLEAAKAATLGLLPDAVLFHGEEDLFQSPEFHAGEFEIQDAASQMVGVLCDPKPGETWWDACAGEGGKTLHLSDLMENRGLIWASDRADWRLAKLKRRAARAKMFNYRAVVWDGGAKLPTKTKFDGVLVDAPCSGVGTWQRNPHARWTTTLTDVKELAEIQKRLLAHVSAAVKPGGKLVYSVCTLTRSETEDVVKNFNDSQTVFEPLSLVVSSSVEKESSRENPAAVKWIWPQDLGGNGMFIAAWRRKAV